MNLYHKWIFSFQRKYMDRPIIMFTWCEFLRKELKLQVEKKKMVVRCLIRKITDFGNIIEDRKEFKFLCTTASSKKTLEISKTVRLEKVFVLNIS